MTNANREAARTALKEIDLDEVWPIQKAKYGSFVCPICGSGTGPHRTGALKIYRDTHRVLCYAGGCFGPKGEDTLGALRRITGKSETEILLEYGACRAEP